ncbi:MAG TPA: helix-turn-helix domain-containing protein, partial [Acidimicrobiia bacterium]|nr:helix-turn-helix domain-containing protein [Acidimicrobiia bacterium]
MTRAGAAPPRQQQSDAEADRRSAIVAAARQCFQKWGLARTRMDDIAQGVGIVRPNLYRYFPSKEAVAAAVSAEESRRINDIRRERLPIEGPVGDLIAASIVLGLQLALEDEYIVDLLRMENRDLVPETIAAATVRYEYWQPVFEHGRARGELRSDLSDDDLIRWLSTVQLHFRSQRALSRTRYFSRPSGLPTSFVGNPLGSKSHRRGAAR